MPTRHGHHLVLTVCKEHGVMMIGCKNAQFELLHFQEEKGVEAELGVNTQTTKGSCSQECVEVEAVELHAHGVSLEASQ